MKEQLKVVAKAMAHDMVDKYLPQIIDILEAELPVAYQAIAQMITKAGEAQALPVVDAAIDAALAPQAGV